MTMVRDELSGTATGLVSWSPVIGGAITAAAFSSILVAFGAAIGLSIASTSSTWRDTSAALTLLSGLFLVLQALVAFGIGGYIAGRARPAVVAPVETVERTDGAHGLLTWAVAVLIGATLTVIIADIGASSRSRSAERSAAEPVLSYELDRLFRAPRRPPNVELTAERAEAGRILLTAASRTGVASEDRTYLVQQVAGVTGLAPADAERRVDDTIGKARAALRKSRQAAVILAFSIAAALLLGSVISWAAAVAGGRHRDGEPLPWLMSHGNFLAQRRATTRPAATTATSPKPRPSPRSF